MKPELVKTDPKVETKKKEIKARVEGVVPDRDIVDCSKLFLRSVRETHAGYPDLSLTKPSEMTVTLWHFMNSPAFAGMVIRVGKKTVGQILGQVRIRPFGEPRRFVFIWNIWMEPEYRKQGLMKQLSQEYFKHLRASNIFHWEAEANDQFTQIMTEYTGQKISKLYNHVGGQL